MPDDPITRLNAALEGRYRIESELGEGGMATVYLADDLKHERKVALKVLKPELAAVVGADRFLAEIKTTANLQHPHILPLFDSGEADGAVFYVMPYIEGEALRDRLDREKQLSVKDAVAIAQKVADALDYAHERGVVHRDIKPGNILLSERGEPLVADFGIALAVAQAGGGRITETGLSLGTPHYMSPEQATGDRDVDPRSDVFSLACVLYEMLAGEPPFSASTAQAVLVKILTTDAPSITSARRTVEPNVASALAQALEKLPADRFESAQEFASALADDGFTYRARPATAASQSPPPPPTAPAPASATARRWLLDPRSIVAAAAIAVAAWALLPADRPGPVTRVSVDFPEDQRVAGGGSFDISRDGSLIVYQGLGPDGQGSQLWARHRAALEATPIRDTEGMGFDVSISPDGREVAFTSRAPRGGSSIRVVPLGGGIARTVAQGSVRCCVRWSPDGAWLYFNAPSLGLSRVPASGGPIEVVTQLDTAAGDYAHIWLDVLPGGEAAVYTVYEGSGGNNPRIFAVRVESGEVKQLTPGLFPRYAEGYLLFADPDGTTLLAQPFDPEALELSGTATPIAEGLRSPRRGWNFYAASQTGSLFYSTGDETDTNGLRLVLVSLEQGEDDVLPLPARDIDAAKWSPDGRSVVFAGDSEGGGGTEIFTYDLELGTEPRQLTYEGSNFSPVFSADGNSVAFSSNRDGTDSWDLFVKALDDDTPARSLITLHLNEGPTQWPSDTLILFRRRDATETTDDDLWILDLSDPENPTATEYLTSEYDLRDFVVSPDGTLAAYTSDETGTPEVYIRSFPVPGERTRVSVGGGEIPFWSPDGDIVYYWTLQGAAGAEGDEFVAARIQRNPTPVVLSRDVVFTGNYYRPATDLHPDGDRVIVAQAADVTAANRAVAARSTRHILVQNWLAELRERTGN
jgi:serine/threonine-protein kinase